MSKEMFTKSFIHRRSRRCNHFMKHFTFAVFVAAFVFFCLSVYKSMSELIINDLQYHSNRVINEAVNEVFSNPDINYFDVKTYGDINVVSVDAYRVNLLKSSISEIIYTRFDNKEYNSFKIHMGSVMCPYLFAGRGPYITVRMVPMTDIDVNFRNENQSYGINQVVNNLYVTVKIDVRALGSVLNYRETVTSDIIAAQTLVTGKIPNTYVTVQKGDVKLDK